MTTNPARRLAAALAVTLAVSGGAPLGIGIDLRAGQEPAAGTANGDVNGDDAIDVADVAYLLAWLFRGGPPPVACESREKSLPVAPFLPDTGQEACYAFDDTAGWHEVPCDDPAACPGQDGFYDTGCPPEGRFADNGDGTITDRCTGLMWQQQQVGRAPWCELLQMVEDLELAGHRDWRLPNARELESIVDYGRLEPLFDPVFEAPIAFERSSTSNGSFAVQAWFAAGGLGMSTNAGKNGRAPGRGVRGQFFAAENGDVNADDSIDVSDAVYLLLWLFLGGLEPAPCGDGSEKPVLPVTGQRRCFTTILDTVSCSDPTCPGQDGRYHTGCPLRGRFTDQGDGTVLDACTGLVWQKDIADIDGDGLLTDGDRLDWCAALQYCEDLELGGRADWRLPNVRELSSLGFFEGKTGVRADPLFLELPSPRGVRVIREFWSSTTYAGDPAQAWRIRYGYSFEHPDKTDGGLVRAVRGGL